MLCIPFFLQKIFFSLENNCADVIMLSYHKLFGGDNPNGIQAASFS
jgi:hypothetical protein